MRHHDEFMYCNHGLYIPGCERCMAGEFKLVVLKERPTEYASLGVQVFYAVYMIEHLALFIDRAPIWWEWLWQ